MNKKSNHKQAKRHFNQPFREDALRNEKEFSTTGFSFRPDRPVPLPIFVEQFSSENIPNVGFIRSSISSLISEAQSLLSFLK